MEAAAVARVFLLPTLLCRFTFAMPEQGSYGNVPKLLSTEQHEISNAYGFKKTMYSDTVVTADVTCHDSSSGNATVHLLLVRSSCLNYEFMECDWLCTAAYNSRCPPECPARTPGSADTSTQATAPYLITDLRANATFTISCDASKVPSRKKRDDTSSQQQAADPAVKLTSTETVKASPSAIAVSVQKPTPLKLKNNQVSAPEIGVYYVVIILESPENAERTFTVSADAKSSYGYLSAVDWPNYYFYMVTVIVYIIYQFTWLLMLACNWRDLLRVQYYIGAVILLGMVEKAMLFAEYDNVNKHGSSIYGAVIAAQLVSCLKRTLARVLIIIVSLGYGIVKPRLGPTMQKVLATGVIYFVVAAIEGCLRVIRTELNSQNDLFAVIPLVVVEVGICWWIFSSLVQTYRTLRLRRNVVKLSVYRHFANALIVALLASVAFAGWFIYAVRLAECVTDLRELWLEEGFWQILFITLLLIVIILWRPSANNQRYAFAPLLDAGDEGDEDENYSAVMGEAFTGMKMRTQGNDTQRKGKDKDYKAEDDLKWIEENIPTSVADQVLTAVDSDEERATTRNEISKMD